MPKVMPVLEIYCGDRTCATRTVKYSDKKKLVSYNTCDWYRPKRNDQPYCVLFQQALAHRTAPKFGAFGIRSTECRAAERMCATVQRNAAQEMARINETLEAGLHAMAEASEKLDASIEKTLEDRDKL